MKRSRRRIPIGEFITIYPRGKHRVWTADFHRDGRHGRLSLKTKNLRVARQRAAALDRQLADGIFDGPSIKQPNKGPAVTITTAIEDYNTHCATEGCRRKTRTKYCGILRKFAAFAAEHGVLRLTNIDLLLIDRYRALRKPLISAKSMHHEGATLKQFLAWAKSRNHITTSPLADVRFTPPHQEPRGGPALDQVNAILAAAPARLCPILSMLAFTGMRSGEGQRLLVQDVDLKGNWIHIVSRPGAETKSGKTRKVPIHPRLRPILAVLPTRSSGYFFTANPSRRYPAGNHHLNTKRLEESFLTVLKSLSIPAGRKAGFTVHSLRHFVRTFTVNVGIPERVVDIWLDHAPDKSMGSVYYKLSDEKSQEFMSTVPFGDGKPAADAGKIVGAA